jgi:hypothetical protein
VHEFLACELEELGLPHGKRIPARLELVSLLPSLQGLFVIGIELLNSLFVFIPDFFHILFRLMAQIVSAVVGNTLVE